MEVDWASLHKMLSDTTRRSILELLAEREALSYTEIMTLLQITNTGRLNYHLKVLGSLLSKDEAGRYHLTDQGKQAAGLLKTFPERVPPAKQLSALKLTASVVLILIGVLLIVSFAVVFLFAFGSATTTTQVHAELSTQAIPQNTTVYLTGWTLSSPALGIAWDAASPVRVFVLNQTQYDVLLLSAPGGGQAPDNFSGVPASWIKDFDVGEGNFTMSLPQGQYYFYAWSASATVLNSFSVSQTPQTQSVRAPSIPPILYLYSSVGIAIGAFLIVLAASILTRRIWKDTGPKP